ncbi:MAG: hypothetical protein H6721_08690 [Sandaracinus sp.]|nr:hypothetical protein [Myxococcales bacterium]MCB9613319.1 hypothetical protein [Sandaracinus sp.]MCB9632194.1 hypothetical protein [Sandaracinus sp.]
MSDERTELDLAIDALRDDVTPPDDGGAATEAAILHAIATTRPTWWKSPSAIVGGLGGLGALVLIVALRSNVSSPEPLVADAPTATLEAEAAPTVDHARDESTPLENEPVDDARDESAAPTPLENEPLDQPLVEAREPSVEVAPRTPRRPRVSSPGALVDVPPEEPEPTPTTAPPTTVAPPTTLEAVPPPPPIPPAELEARRVRFRDAHRLQYGHPGVSLAAWDRFLHDFPGGPFADEARYYRALTLVRLGRRDEARAVLEAFAAGRYGNTHRGDARRVLERL